MITQFYQSMIQRLDAAAIERSRRVEALKRRKETLETDLASSVIAIIEAQSRIVSIKRQLDYLASLEVLNASHAVPDSVAEKREPVDPADS